MQLVNVVTSRGLRLIIENPWATSRNTYLQCNFIKPTFIDKNRAMRGDSYKKPTAYWFFGCHPTMGYTIERNANPVPVYSVSEGGKHPGKCDRVRSEITSAYARNFICDNILGLAQPDINPSLFDNI